MFATNQTPEATLGDLMRSHCIAEVTPTFPSPSTGEDQDGGAAHTIDSLGTPTSILILTSLQIDIEEFIFM